MNLLKNPDVIMWQAVILQAVRDAQANEVSQQCGTEKIYKWSKSMDCKDVCYYAQLDHDSIRIGFINIYLDFLKQQEGEIQGLAIERDMKPCDLHKELDEIKLKRQEAYERLEKIKCQKL